MLKAILWNDWDNAVEEIIEDDQEVHSKQTFDECMKKILKETLRTETNDVVLSYLKKTKKPFKILSKSG